MRVKQISEERRSEKKREADKLRRIGMIAARMVYLEEHGLFCDVCTLAAPMEELSIRLACNAERGKKPKRSADSILALANETKRKKLMEGAKVICASCHHRTAADGTSKSAHGVRRYQLGCRCPVCRMAMRLLISIENGGEIPHKKRKTAKVEKEVKAYGGKVSDDEAIDAIPLLAHENNQSARQMSGLWQLTKSEIAAD